MKLQPLIRLVERSRGWSDERMVAFNAGLAAFVAVAHGGAWLASQSHEQIAIASDVRTTAAVSSPLSGLVLMTALWARRRPNHRRAVLCLHAFVDAASAVWLLAWALGLLVKGIPEGGGFAWSPGILSAWVLYTAVVFARYSGLADAHTFDRVPWLVTATLAVEIGVLMRLLA